MYGAWCRRWLQVLITQIAVRVVRHRDRCRRWLRVPWIRLTVASCKARRRRWLQPLILLVMCHVS